MTDVVVGPTASERAVSILTAYCASREHAFSEGNGEDVAGLAFFDLIDELLDPICEAETDEDLEAARELLTRVVINLLGIMEAMIEELEIDPYDMIKEIVQENLRRTNVAG
jgi:hypothetical protein